jgi:hypothetical protein
VQSVLEEIIESSPSIRKLVIEIDGKPQGLVKFANDRLHIVRREAVAILNRYYQPISSKFNLPKPVEELCKWFSKNRDRLLLALGEGHIQDLRKAVEIAKSSLQSAICLAHMASSNSW